MEVREIPAEATYELRSRILRPGQPLDANRYPMDKVGVHFGLFLPARASDRLISTVTAHPEENPRFPGQGHWRIRGMATDLGFQGQGYGLKVLLALLAWGREKRIPLFWCNARAKAIPFYERQGFRVESELFELPGIGPHKVMRIDL
jgi:GNAT superfamily N-acetyltransferase